MGGARSEMSTSLKQKSEKEIITRCKVQAERMGWDEFLFYNATVKAAGKSEEKRGSRHRRSFIVN